VQSQHRGGAGLTGRLESNGLHARQHKSVFEYPKKALVVQNRDSREGIALDDRGFLGARPTGQACRDTIQYG
jgi:hypothetical protein